MSPLRPLAVALVAGIISGRLLGPPAGVSLSLALGSLAAYAVVLFLATGVRRSRWRVLAALCCAGAVGLCIGARSRRRERVVKAADHVVEGDVLRTVRGHDGRWRMTLEVAGVTVVDKRGRRPPALQRLDDRWIVQVGAEAAARHLPGSRVILRARGLRRPSRRNFDDGGDLPRRRPLFAVATGAILRVRDAPWPRRALHGIRRRVRAGLEASLEQPARGLAVALTLGDRSGLGAETVGAFRRTGAAHLLAVSGLHVSLLAALVLGIFRLVLLRTPAARRVRVEVLAAPVAIAACWAYATLTGLAPPAFRAAIMATVVLAARAFGRPTASDHALATSAAILLVLEPALILRPGFHLSYIAVMALRGASRAAEGGAEDGEVPSWRKLLAGARALLATSTAITAATMPVLAHWFGVLSPWSVVVNLIVIPAMTAVVLPSTACLAVAGAVEPALGALLGGVVGPILRGLLLFLGWASTWPLAATSVPRPGGVITALLVAAALLLTRSGRPRVIGVALGVVTLSTWGCELYWPRRGGDLSVTVLDVGAGAAILIEGGASGRVLVDTGPREGDLTRPNDVVAALQRHGVGPLSLVVVSHDHADHAAGLWAVLDTVGARRLWPPLAGRGASSPTLALVERRGGSPRVVSPRCGRRELGRLRVEVLHSCEEGDRELSTNDRSRVLRVVLGEIAVLLPGDIEGDVEARLVASGRPLRSTVLVLPHHGSRTSSTEPFLDAVAPRLAIASCGRSRRQALPHPSVVERLGRLGVPLLTTAEHGAVRIVTDGRTLEVASARLGPLRIAGL